MLCVDEVWEPFVHEEDWTFSMFHHRIQQRSTERWFECSWSDWSFLLHPKWEQWNSPTMSNKWLSKRSNSPHRHFSLWVSLLTNPLASKRRISFLSSNWKIRIVPSRLLVTRWVSSMGTMPVIRSVWEATRRVFDRSLVQQIYQSDPHEVPTMPMSKVSSNEPLMIPSSSWNSSWMVKP